MRIVDENYREVYKIDGNIIRDEYWRERYIIDGNRILNDYWREISRNISYRR